MVQTQSSHRTGDQQARAHRPASWWRRPWIIPLVLTTAWFLQHQIKPFAKVSFQEKLSPIPPHHGFPEYYPLLMAHITFGTIAMLTVILQVWPMIRVRYPVVHRWSGRLYVISALGGGACGLAIVRFAPPVGQIGVIGSTSIWILTSAAGYVLARRRNWELHRRFMLYSFAVVMNNVWGALMVSAVTTWHLQPNLFMFLEASRWVGWVVNLMAVQVWLYYTEGRALQLPSSAKSRVQPSEPRETAQVGG